MRTRQAVSLRYIPYRFNLIFGGVESHRPTVHYVKSAMYQRSSPEVLFARLEFCVYHLAFKQRCIALSFIKSYPPFCILHLLRKSLHQLSHTLYGADIFQLVGNVGAGLCRAYHRFTAELMSHSGDKLRLKLIYEG